jgi:hypothetical protein
VSRLTTATYMSHGNTDNLNHPEVEDCLSTLEKQLCNSFTRIEVPGKRNKCIPLLLTADRKTAIEVLVDETNRERADIDADNLFVFARGKDSGSCIRGSEVLRQSSENCRVTRPKLFRSANLRKHTATMSKKLSLKKNELDQLAQFMGHDVRIHR